MSPWLSWAFAVSLRKVFKIARHPGEGVGGVGGRKEKGRLKFYRATPKPKTSLFQDYKSTRLIEVCKKLKTFYLVHMLTLGASVKTARKFPEVDPLDGCW